MKIGGYTIEPFSQLRGADLSEEYLIGADLRGADIGFAYLEFTQPR